MAELDEPVVDIPIKRWPLVLAVFAVACLFFYLLQPILLPFVLGAVIGYLGDPLVDRVEARGGSRTLGVVLVFLAFGLLLLVATLFAMPMLLQQLDILIQKIPAFYAWLRDSALPWMQSRVSIPSSRLPEIDWSGQLLENWQSLGKASAKAVGQITGSGLGMLLWLANIVLVPVVAFYFMRDWDNMVRKLLELLPKAWQSGTRTLAAQADEVLGAFLRGQFVVMCALGVLYSSGLWIVGVQAALLLGLLAGLASIVPYLGFVVGITASMIVAYVQFQEFSILLWVLLVFGVGQLVESLFLTPVLVGDRIGLHPVAVIFALMAGGQLAGFLGVLVALPVAAVVMVFVRHAISHYRASNLYGG
ncbi:AI-2E family transporter [Chromatocurvus halotolerans]|uniref:Putative PurR-regulated permease PerM n=1 Tax=Chromatocurvus halotolerans TaxID=1132028 RepID=A0A4R2L0A9_9GAMM|nr:AI-2E family transporter [Chromatocurvus halotolerans]TCO75958.1 putative PurR-regulated permease PerM [Chromatocurvus halotolerans]